VVDALQRIHEALVPGGVLVDTQPVGLRLSVRVEGEPAGELEEDDWLETVAAVDARVEEAIEAHLFELQHEVRYAVVHGFDSGSEALEEATEWEGTRIPPDVMERLDAAQGQVEIEVGIRLRLLARTSSTRHSPASSTAPPQSEAAGLFPRTPITAAGLCGAYRLRVTASPVSRPLISPRHRSLAG
jgi:hypothetical protein